MERSYRKLRLAMVALAGLVPFAFTAPALAQVDGFDSGEIDLQLPPGDLADLLGGTPAPTAPPAPGSDQTVPSPTDPAGGADPTSALPSGETPDPTSESAVPETPLSPVVDPVLEAIEGGGEGGETEPTDICKQITTPVSDGGAPIYAECPIQQKDGGVQVDVCIVLLTIATCQQQEPTTSTTQPGNGGATTTTQPGNGGGGGNGSGGGGTAVEPASTGGSGGGDGSGSGSGGGSTLPFTGGPALLLAAIGSALAGGGGIATRIAKRRV